MDIDNSRNSTHPTQSIEELKKNPSWCAKAWIHQFIDPTGRVKPCCRFWEKEGSNRLSDKSFEKIFWGEWMDSIRSRMLKGEKIPGCQRCYEEEDSGKPFSLRQNYNRLLFAPDHYEVDLETPQIGYLELAISNDCNLKCRMCDSRYSKQWYDDEIKLTGKTYAKEKSSKVDIETFKPYIKDLFFLKFTGGEPLMTKDYFRFLDWVIEDGKPEDMKLNISTNCTIMPTEKHIKQWSQFKEIQLNLSLDATGPAAGYIRHPVGWDKIEKVVQEYMRLTSELPLVIGLRSTVSLYNVMEMKEVYQWWQNQVEAFRVSPLQYYINPTHLTFPMFLSLQALPAQYKRMAEDSLRSTNVKLKKVQNSIDQLIQFMNLKDNSNLLNETKQYTLDLDKIRNENFSDTFPYYKELFSDIATT